MTALILVLLAAPPPGPLAEAQRGHRELDGLVHAEAPDPAKIARAAQTFFDAEEMLRAALGPSWRDFRPAEQAELTRAFLTVLTETWVARSLGTGRQEHSVEWGEERLDGKRATVSGTLLVARRRVPLELRLWSSRGRWRVYDVVAGGSSAVDGYAEQFRRVLDAQGPKGLLAKLKAVADSLAPAPPVAARARDQAGQAAAKEAGEAAKSGAMVLGATKRLLDAQSAFDLDAP